MGLGMFIGEVAWMERHMAETFFIRGQVTIPSSDGAYTSSEIDLGSFVNVGLKSSTLIKIHDIQVQVMNSSGFAPRLGANTAECMAYQLTTQAQTSLVGLDDRSVVASGIHSLRNPDSATNSPTQGVITDHLPQTYVDGYLVAVDTLFLAGQAGADFEDDLQVNICMEVSMAKATQANAAALALSQQ